MRKMKQYKKMAALFSAAGMLAGAVGCGDKPAPENGTAKEDPSDDKKTESSDNSERENAAASYNETGYPIVDEEITVSVAGAMPIGLEDWTNLAVVEEYARRLGIRMDCTFYPTDWSTEVTLMVAGNTLPDLIINGALNVTDVNGWGDEGYFLDMSKYLDLMPNMTAYFEEHPEVKAFCTTENGNIYGLPRMRTDLTDRLSRSFINQRWLDNLGLDAPASMEELYDVLVAFKEKDANGNGDASDEIPLLYSPECDPRLERTLLAAYGIYTTDVGYVLQADDSGKVELANTTENYKEFLTFMNRLYKEGLMEQEAFTITSDEAKTKQAGDVYGVFGWSAPFVLGNSDITYDMDYTALVGLTPNVCDEGSAGLSSALGGNYIVAISADTKYPEALCRFLDYFYTEEGVEAAAHGYEGITFDFVTNDLLGVEVAKMHQPEGYASEEEFRYKAAVFNMSLNLIETNPDREALFTVDPEVLESDEVMKEYGWAAKIADSYRKNGSKGSDVYPTISYTADEASRRTALVTDIRTYLVQAKAQFITGELDIEKDWDTYLGTVEQMGISNLLEIEQVAYDRYMSNMK